MRIKPLFEDRYTVVGVMDGDSCPAEEFLVNGEQNTLAVRIGLREMLKHVASSGIENVPSKWVHEASKEEQVYEFIKGPIRLFFFKGKDKQIAVCTTGVRKSGRKADKSSVRKAAALRRQYLNAVRNGTLTLVDDHED